MSNEFVHERIALSENPNIIQVSSADRDGYAIFSYPAQCEWCGIVATYHSIANNTFVDEFIKPLDKPEGIFCVDCAEAFNLDNHSMEIPSDIVHAEGSRKPAEGTPIPLGYAELHV